jgi:hypothetical protein
MSTTYNDFNIKPGMTLWAEMGAAYQAEYFTFLADVAAAEAAQAAAEVDMTDEYWYERQL